METKSLKSFIYLEDGSVNGSVLDVVDVRKKLKAGFYNLKAFHTMDGYKVELEQVELPDYSESCIEYKEIQPFNDYLSRFKQKPMKDKIESLGYKHKLGLLLYGKQGTGKTVYTSCMARDIINEGGITFNIKISGNSFSEVVDFLKSLRKVHTERFLFIFDESENLLKEHEGGFKNFLDGYDSINDSISVFTTNYIDKIPKAIYERPSRIRFSVELKGISCEKTIKGMLKSALKREPSQEEIKQLMNKTIDEIKEYIINDIFGYNEDKKETKGLGFRN